MILWGLLYVSDYALTITCARLYGRQKTIVFEGSYEITPFFQRDINSLRVAKSQRTGRRLRRTPQQTSQCQSWVPRRHLLRERGYRAAIGSQTLIRGERLRQCRDGRTDKRFRPARANRCSSSRFAPS